MVDVSVVRPNVDYLELKEMAEFARRYRFIGAHSMTCYIPELVELLRGVPEVLIGGVVGFPFGTSNTEAKVLETELAIEAGAKEIDMVQNVGFLMYGWDERVEHDIRQVVNAASPLPVKVILETAYLNEDQIVRACRIAQRAGVGFAKTSTGHAPTAATPEVVALMKQTVGDAVVVKAAGGMTNVAEFVSMYHAGARRFGIGLHFAKRIIAELEAMDAPYEL
jgi:deoxyribose-phosphate aldolase